MSSALPPIVPAEPPAHRAAAPEDVVDSGAFERALGLAASAHAPVVVPARALPISLPMSPVQEGEARLPGESQLPADSGSGASSSVPVMVTVPRDGHLGDPIGSTAFRFPQPGPERAPMSGPPPHEAQPMVEGRHGSPSDAHRRGAAMPASDLDPLRTPQQDSSAGTRGSTPAMPIGQRVQLAADGFPLPAPASDSGDVPTSRFAIRAPLREAPVAPLRTPPVRDPVEQVPTTHEAGESAPVVRALPAALALDVRVIASRIAPALRRGGMLDAERPRAIAAQPQASASPRTLEPNPAQVAPRAAGELLMRLGQPLFEADASAPATVDPSVPSERPLPAASVLHATSSTRFPLMAAHAFESASIAPVESSAVPPPAAVRASSEPSSPDATMRAADSESAEETSIPRTSPPVARTVAHSTMQQGQERSGQRKREQAAPAPAAVAASGAATEPATQPIALASPSVPAPAAGASLGTADAAGTPGADSATLQRAEAALLSRLSPERRAADQVTLRFEGEGGLEGRLRVSVRGDQVHARFLTEDAKTMERLSGEMRSLQRSLEERGFRDARVSIQDLRTPAGAEARPDARSAEERRQGEPGRRHSGGEQHEDSGPDGHRGRRNAREGRR